MTSDDDETYYSAFLPTAGLILAIGVPCGVLVALVQFRFDVPLIALVAGAVVGAIATILFTLLAIACYPVVIGPAGVRSYTFWGSYHTIAWDAVASVGRFNLLGLRYATVTSVAGPVIYVPYFLADFRRFRSRVADFAGTDNPLARALAEVGR